MGNFLIAELLLASQEGFCPEELVSLLNEIICPLFSCMFPYSDVLEVDKYCKNVN
jgi:hypothetical protein